MSHPAPEPAVIVKRRFINIDMISGDVSCGECGRVFIGEDDIDRAYEHVAAEKCAKRAKG